MTTAYDRSTPDRVWEQRSLTWLLVILLLALLLRLAYFNGIVGGDDLSVAGLSLRFHEQGYITPNSHYSSRWGLLWPMSFVLGWFGTGDWQMGILPLLASLGGVALAYGIGSRLAGSRVGLLAAFLMAIFPLDISQSSILFPDMPLGTFCALAIWLALIAPDSRRPWLVAFLGGLAWGYGYMIKIEAFFLLFPVLALWLSGRISFGLLVAVCLGCAVFVIGENLFYYFDTGHLLYRLKAIAGQHLHVEEGFGGGELWVFPKAWFITFYEFSVYYYLLFAGLIWAAVSRQRALIVPVVWAIAFLLWLEFGVNPLAETISFKSHLPRYCSMLSVPVVIIIAALMLAVLRSWGRILFGLGFAGTVALSLFLANFNTLSSEREAATKIAVHYAVAQKLFPLYLDEASYYIALFMLRGQPEEKQLEPLQHHNYATGETKVADLDAIDGYALINTEFQRHRHQRYGLVEVDMDALGPRVRRVHEVDNPMNGLAYAEARLMQAMANLIPVAAIRDKIAGTAGHLLDDDDVVIYRVQPKSDG